MFKKDCRGSIPTFDSFFSSRELKEVRLRIYKREMFRGVRASAQGLTLQIRGSPIKSESGPPSIG